MHPRLKKEDQAQLVVNVIVAYLRIIRKKKRTSEKWSMTTIYVHNLENWRHRTNDNY